MATKAAAAEAAKNPTPSAELAKAFEPAPPPAKLKLGVLRTHTEAVMPQYQSDGAACFDLHAVESAAIAPGIACTVGTGLAFDIPDGWVLLVYSRSGHGFKNGVRLANCVGVIDPDYIGEVRVRLHNDSRGVFIVNKGDRIAQAVLQRAEQVNLVELQVITKSTERGCNGLGSTGA